MSVDHDLNRSSLHLCCSGPGALVMDNFQVERNWRRAVQNWSDASDVIQRKQVIIWKQNESVKIYD